MSLINSMDAVCLNGAGGAADAADEGVCAAGGGDADRTNAAGSAKW